MCFFKLVFKLKVKLRSFITPVVCVVFVLQAPQTVRLTSPTQPRMVQPTATSTVQVSLSICLI